MRLGVLLGNARALWQLRLLAREDGAVGQSRVGIPWLSAGRCSYLMGAVRRATASRSPRPLSSIVALRRLRGWALLGRVSAPGSAWRRCYLCARHVVAGSDVFVVATEVIVTVAGGRSWFAIGTSAGSAGVTGMSGCGCGTVGWLWSERLRCSYPERVVEIGAGRVLFERSGSV
jgi:hypothetical protein